MKTKVICFFLLFLFPLMQINAQQISEEYVPEDVIISMKYKYPDANINTWETNKGNFLAQFKLGDQQGSAEFTANGKWVISHFLIAEKELPSPITTYYKNNYKNRDFVISSSELVKEGNGDTYYYVVVKKPGINQPQPSELFFDLSGNLTSKIEPEENKPVDEIIEKVPVIDTTTETGPVKLSQKELPTPINNYLKTYYPDHQLKEAIFDKNENLGEAYHLVLKQQGLKDEVELFFDINGALLKKIDKAEERANQVQNDANQQNNNQKNDTNQVADNGQQKPTPEEIRKAKEGEPIPDSKVPALAKTHFASKLKKATKVNWFLLNRKYIAHYELAGRKGKATYDEDGNWQETRNDMDPEALSPVIQGYLKDNYRRYKTIKADFIQATPRIKFYEVHVVEKSNKESNPPVTKVFFEGNGRYSSVERPYIDEPDEQKQLDEEFLKYVDEDFQVIEKGSGVNEEINPRELPTKAMSYIKTNFKEHKIKQCRYLFDDDIGSNVYYVTVKLEGDKYETELYFKLSGDLIKKIDPTEQQYKDDHSDKTDVKKNDEKNPDFETEVVDPSDLPSGIKNYLKTNYPDNKIASAAFGSNEEFDNIYMLELKQSGTKNTILLWFDLDGRLVKAEEKE